VIVADFEHPPVYHMHKESGKVVASNHVAGSHSGPGGIFRVRTPVGRHGAVAGAFIHGPQGYVGTGVTIATGARAAERLADDGHTRLARLGRVEDHQGDPDFHRTLGAAKSATDGLPHAVFADYLEENDLHHDEATLRSMREATGPMAYHRHATSGKVVAAPALEAEIRGQKALEDTVRYLAYKGNVIKVTPEYADMEFFSTGDERYSIKRVGKNSIRFQGKQGKVQPYADRAYTPGDGCYERHKLYDSEDVAKQMAGHTRLAKEDARAEDPPESQGDGDRYNVPAFHGSKVPNFQMKYHVVGRGGYRYWTDSEDHASAYAGKDGTLIKSKLKIEKPLDLMEHSGPTPILAEQAAKTLRGYGVDVEGIEFKSNAPMWRQVQSEGLKDRLTEAGYDAIVLSEKGGDKSYFIMGDAQIHANRASSRPKNVIASDPRAPEIRTQTHHFTRKEWVGDGVGDESDRVGQEHRAAVESAIREGNPVPDRVLAGYPDLDGHTRLAKEDARAY